MRFRRENRVTFFDRLVKSAQDGFFGVLLTMNKGAHEHLKWSLFGMTWDFLQLLAYALYRVFPWEDVPQMHWLLTLLLYVNPTNATLKVEPLAAVVLLFTSLLWIFTTIVAAVWSAYCFSIGDFSTVLPLKFLRATGGLTVVLFVPVVGLLISVFKCSSSTWSGTAWPCWGWQHLSVVSVVCALLPLFWLFCITVSAVFFDRNYKSTNITARAHGRVGITMVTIKTGLTLVFTIAYDADPWFLVFVCLVCGVVWLYLWIRFLPAYNQRMNQAWSAFGAVFLWASLCTALALTLEESEVNIAGWIFYVGSPAAAYAGYAGAYLQWISYSDHAMKGAVPGGPGLRTAFDVELRARYILRDVITDEKIIHAGTHGRSAVKIDRVSATVLPNVGHDRENTYEIDTEESRDKSHDGVGLTDFVANEVHSTRAERAKLQSSSGSRRRSQARASQIVPSVTDADSVAHADRRGQNEPHEDRDRPRHLGSDPVVPAEERAVLIAAAADLLEAACEAFPGASMAELLRANFIRVFFGDADAELSCILAGLSKNPSLDVRFLLLQAKQQLVERSEAGGDIAVVGAGPASVHHSARHGAGGAHRESLSIVERVVYEKLLAESTEWGLKSRCLELSFWSELLRPAPVLLRVHNINESMSAAIIRAQTCFERLLIMRPDSVEAMQSYAVFLLEVKREIVLAEKLFTKATEVLRNRGEIATNAGHVRPNMPSEKNETSVSVVISPRQAVSISTGFPAGLGIDAASAVPAAVVGRERRRASTSGESIGTTLNAPAPRAHPYTPAHDPLYLDPYVLTDVGAANVLEPTEEQQREGRQRRHSSISGRGPVTKPDFASLTEASFPSHADRRVHVFEPPFNSEAHAPFLELRHDVHDVSSDAATAIEGVRTKSRHADADARVQLKNQAGSKMARQLPVDAASVSSSIQPGFTGDPAIATVVRQSSTGSASNASGRASKSRRFEGGAILSGASSIGKSSHVVPSERIKKSQRGHLNASATLSIADSSLEDHDMTQSRPQGKKKLAVAALNAYAARVGQSRRSDAAAQSIRLHADSPREDRLRPRSGSDESGRNSNPPGVRPLSGRERAFLERAELGMTSDELEALETAREERLSTFAAHARRTDAARRLESDVQINAQALRDAIKARALLTEPFFVTLRRIVASFFLLAVVLNIVFVCLTSTMMLRLKSTATLLQESIQRQGAIESILHVTQQLVLLNAAIAPGGDATKQAMAAQLLTRAAALDAGHRKLLEEIANSGLALADETSFYTKPILAQQDLSTALGSTSGVYEPFTTSVSFSDLGASYAAHATSLAQSPLANITSSQRNVWFLMTNGPGVLRTSCAFCTALLQQRADSQSAYIASMNYIVTALAVLVFGGASLCVLLPIANEIQRSSQQCFSIFLNLPRVLLTDMQNECAAQIAELRSLFEDSDAFAELAGPIDMSLLLQAAANREANGAHPNAAANSKSSPSSAQPSAKGDHLTPVAEGVDDDADDVDTPLVGSPLAPSEKKSHVAVYVRETGQESINVGELGVSAQPARTLRRSTSRVHHAASIAHISEALSAAIKPPTSIGGMLKARSFRFPSARPSDHVARAAASGPAMNSSQLPSTGMGLRGQQEPQADVDQAIHAPPPLPPGRRFKTSFGQTLFLLLRFSLPVVSFSIYYLALYGFTRSTASGLDAQRTFIVGLGQLQVALPAPDLRALAALTTSACPTTTLQLTPTAVIAPYAPGAAWAGTGCNVTALSEALVSLNDALGAIAGLRDAFVYGTLSGGAASAAAQSSPDAKSVFFVNACIGGDAQPPMCDSVYSGVVATGALATLTAYANHLRQAIEEQAASVNAATSSCPAPLLSSHALVADTLVHVYIPPALNALQVSFFDALGSAVTYHTIVLAVVTVIAGIVLAVTFTGLVQRSIASMDSEMKRVRATLLLFPSDVLASVAAFLQTTGGGGIGVVPGVLDVPDESDEVA